jgi:hypothetical protein
MARSAEGHQSDKKVIEMRDLMVSSARAAHHGHSRQKRSRSPGYQQRGGEAVIPSLASGKLQHAVDKAVYALRDRIERVFNRAKNSRRVATRSDKLIESFAAFVLQFFAASIRAEKHRLLGCGWSDRVPWGDIAWDRNFREDFMEPGLS